jgi:hypothetical protein
MQETRDVSFHLISFSVIPFALPHYEESTECQFVFVLEGEYLCGQAAASEGVVGGGAGGGLTKEVRCPEINRP